MAEETTPPAASGHQDSSDSRGSQSRMHAIIAADFDTTESAWSAYEMLKEAAATTSVRIDAVAVVKKDNHGVLEVQKATDHSTRRGLGWGVAGGILLGAIFPPSILMTAGLFGAGGAAVGKVRELRHKSVIAEELEAVIQPGHSGILALVSDAHDTHVNRALAAADRFVASAVDEIFADEVAKAADEAVHENPAAPAGS